MSIGVSKICSAFKERTIGTKVWGGYLAPFMALVQAAIEKHDWTSGVVPGQAVLPLPEAIPYISCGNRSVVGLNEGDLIGRMHRRVPGVYARRSWDAPPAKTCSVVIYTRAAYNGDPDVVKEGDTTSDDYVLVAVLSSCTDDQPYPPIRLIHNIAGGNLAFLPATKPPTGSGLEYTSRYVRDIDGAGPGRDVVFGPDAVLHDLKLLHRIIDLARESEKAAEGYILVAD